MTTPQLIERIRRHIAIMAPHQKGRVTAKLLIEAVGEMEAMFAACTNSIADHKATEEPHACPVCKAKLPPIVWCATSPGLIPVVTPERYAKFQPSIQAWYKPVFAQPAMPTSAP